MAGPEGSIAEGCALIKEKVTLEKPTPMGLCLGCHHTSFERVYDGCKVRGVRYDMENSLLEAVEHYKRLCDKHDYKPTLRKVDTPFIDTSTLDPDFDKEPQGVLATSAASILMKVLYAARLARFDLLKAITNLASRLTKWTRR